MEILIILVLLGGITFIAWKFDWFKNYTGLFGGENRSFYTKLVGVLTVAYTLINTSWFQNSTGRLGKVRDIINKAFGALRIAGFAFASSAFGAISTMRKKKDDK